jgi:hypothetical protein
MSMLTEAMTTGSPGVLHDLRADDERLYQELMRNHASPRWTRRQAFFHEADAFLDRLQDAPRGLDSISSEDFAWLTETAQRWEVIYASILNVPKNVVITTSPTQLRKTEQDTVYTAEQVERWLQVRAYDLSRIRKVNRLLRQAYAIQRSIQSTLEETIQDWRYAQADFAWQVLSGTISFATQLPPNAYERLQEVWMREVKQHRAFLIWEDEGCPESPDGGVSDYELACAELRRFLAGTGFAKPTLPQAFAEARAYLEQHFLDKRGRLDLKKPATEAMVRAKAQEIWTRCGQDDADANWSKAESRTRQFYENVIPAVTRKSPESTRLALEALSWDGNGAACEIANCFEAALAIYFFDADVVRQLFQQSRTGLWP